MLSSGFRHRPTLQLLGQVSFRLLFCPNLSSSSSSPTSSSCAPSPSPSAAPSSGQRICQEAGFSAAKRIREAARRKKRPAAAADGSKIGSGGRRRSLPRPDEEEQACGEEGGEAAARREGGGGRDGGRKEIEEGKEEGRMETATATAGTGTERTGTERMERTGMERTGTERTGMERTGTERTGTAGTATATATGPAGTGTGPAGTGTGTSGTGTGTAGSGTEPVTGPAGTGTGTTGTGTTGSGTAGTGTTGTGTAATGSPRRRRRKEEMLQEQAEMERKVELLLSESASSATSAAEVGDLMRKKAFRSVTAEQLRAVMEELKRFLSGDKRKAWWQVMVRNPGVMEQEAEELHSRLKALSEFEVGEEAMVRLAGSAAMAAIPAEHLRETLAYLSGIGMPGSSIGKIVCKNPKTLRLSVEASMRPTVEFLAGTGMPKIKLLKLLERRPELFAMSIDADLRLKHRFFFRDLGLPPHKFGTALRSMTQYPIATILARLQAIRDHGFSDSDVLDMVRKQPNILANSSGSIERKLDFLLRLQRRPPSEIVRFPACLGYSLPRRIVPRFRFLEENRLSKPYSLSTILATKQSDFIDRCRLAADPSTTGP